MLLYIHKPEKGVVLVRSLTVTSFPSDLDAGDEKGENVRERNSQRKGRARVSSVYGQLEERRAGRTHTGEGFQRRKKRGRIPWK